MAEPIDPKFLAASIKPKKSLEGSLLEDAWAAFRDHPLSVAKGVGKLPISFAEGVTGMVYNAGQGLANAIAIPLGMNPIHVRGATHTAPKTMTENSDNIMRILTLGGKDVGDAYKKKQLEKFDLHKNPDGTYKNKPDQLGLDIDAGLEGLKEVSGFKPLGRALSGDYPGLTEEQAIEQRIQDGVFGVLGVAGTLSATKAAFTGKVPGVALVEKQAGELVKGAGKVKTANDLAQDMGLPSGEVVMEAGATGKSLQDVLLSHTKAKVAKDLQPMVQDIQTGKLTPADVAIANLSKGIRSGKLVDNKALNAEGAAFKMIDGSDMYVDKVDTSSPLAQRFQEAMINPMLLEAGEIKAIRQQAQLTDSFTKLAKINPDAPNNHIIAGVIAEGALDPVFIDPLAEHLGITPTVARQQLVDHFVHSASGYGKGLSALSFGNEARAMFDTMGEMFSPETIKKVKDQILAGGRDELLNDQTKLDGFLEEAAQSIVSKPGKPKKVNPLEGTYGVVQNVSKLGTQAMLSYVGTPARNFVNSHILNDLSMFEDSMVDTARTVGGKLTGAEGVVRPFEARRSATANAVYDMTKLLIKNTDHYNALVTAIDAIPTTSKFLKGKASQLYGGLAEMKGTGAGWSDAAFETASKYLSAVGTIGELPMRRAIWGARAIKNLDYISEFQQIAKKFPEVSDPLKRLEMIEDWATDPNRIKNKYQLSDAQLSKFDSEMRLAISDSHIHTLKTQLSFQTEFAKVWLDRYNSIPFADTILPAFPKMLFNTYRWVTEHNPVGMLSILDKDVRATMMAGAEGGFKTAAAQRMYAKYVSGAGMMAAMYAAKSGQMPGVQPGARPFELQVGDKTIDTRALSPGDKSVYLADLLFKVGEQGKTVGQALSEWTPSEVTDFIFSQRRMGDIPVFGLEKIVQDWTSGDPDRTTKRVQEWTAEWISRFGTPLRNAKLFTDMISPEDQVARDKTVDPMLGPLRSKVPYNSLPAKIDPTVGAPDPVEDPISGPLLNLVGVRIDKTPKLLQMFKEINYPVYRLVGNNGDPLLDREVAKNVGKMLQTPLSGKDTRPLGEVIASDVMKQMADAYNTTGVKDPVLSNEAQAKVLNKYFADLRVKALKQAYANPDFQLNYLEAKVNAYPDLDSAQKKALLDELYKQGQIRQLGNTGDKKQSGK